MAPIKIGILGTANIAKRSVIPEILNLNDEFTLVGIASRSRSKALEAAKANDLAPFFSYDDLINHTEVDAIYIPLPNSLHFEFVRKALSKGLHVLVEKSLATSVSEVNELVQLARKMNVLLMENFQFRFHNQLKYLIDQIESGVIGEIRSLNAAFCFPPFPDVNNIRYKKHLGGGALLDAGAYTLKISSIILGKDLIVEAAKLNTSEGYDVDIWGGAFLSNLNAGTFASATFGFDHYYQCGVQVIGSKGKIVTNRLFTAPKNIKPVFEIEIQGKKKEVFNLRRQKMIL